VKDHWFKKAGLTLKDWGFNLVEQRGPDAEHFGNWVLIATRDNLAIRVFRDRGHVNLDLMPIALFKPGADESNWFTWDVVARALGLPTKVEVEPLTYFHEDLGLVNHLFAPKHWEKTRELLAHVEEEKRRRFTEDRRVRERVHA
jgi:hypothetical protein